MSEPLSILVVDDNSSMAKSLVDVLDLKGFIAYAASSAAEALEILRDHTVDLMVTDVIMPEMNGVDLYHEAKKTRPQLTTFLMTAYAANDLIQKGIADGIKTVLPKPLDIDFLLLLLCAVGRISNKAG
jgi:DNA-binding NtrC family response regulator